MPANLSDIITNLPALVYLTDFETHQVQWANFEFYKSLGYSEIELNVKVDKNFYLEIFHPDDLPAISAYQEYFLNGGEVFHARFRLMHKSGEWSWFQSTDQVYKFNDKGKPNVMIGVAVEIIATEKIRNRTQDPILTARETEVARLLSKGFSAKQIADQMDISLHTVATHKHNSMRKLRVHNTAGIVKYALTGNT